MRKLYRLLRSVKLALVLIAIIVLLAIVATLIPQGREDAYYQGTYPVFVANVIRVLHFDRFYSSAVFLIPCGLFFINLALCTFYRLFTRIRKGLPSRHGPDVMHIGLLMIILSGIMIFQFHREGTVWLMEKESFQLPNGYEIVLKDFQYLTYEDRRPRDWISHLEVNKDDVLIQEARVEVNHPLSVAGYKVFQSSYRYEPTVTLEGSAGRSISLGLGQGFRYQDRAYLFSGFRLTPEEELLIQMEEREGGRTETTVLKEGKPYGDFFLTDVVVYKETGLQVVKEPIRPLMLISFLIVCIGLILTFYQKMGDMKK